MLNNAQANGQNKYEKNELIPIIIWISYIGKKFFSWCIPKKYIVVDSQNLEVLWKDIVCYLDGYTK